jgi:hypothetical protein
MSRETKKEIIRAAYLTLLADKRIAEEERARLKDIAAALQISEIHFDAIVKGTESTQVKSVRKPLAPSRSFSKS